MRYRTDFLVAALVVVGLGWPLFWSLHVRPENGPVRIYLWAWERPENLSQADPAQVGVAWLAETIRLSGASVTADLRRQPLSVAPGAEVMAVVRIEANYVHPPILDRTRQQTVVTLLDRLVEERHLRELQIDFDATLRQREFYRDLLAELHRLRPKLHLSITALTSWCLADRWIHDLPVEEAVPMLFRMGPDTWAVRERLQEGEDFQEPLCRHSFGLSMDEPVPRLPGRRRVYWFNPKPWTRDDINLIARGVE